MKDLMHKLTQTSAGTGMTILRVILGITFMMHGSQKLFGAFGGGGLEGTAKFMASLGLEPSYVMAVLAALGEFGGGLLLLLGLFTRFGAFLTGVVSLVAIFSVHISKGFFMSGGGYEYALVLLAASLALLIDGAGKYSLDSGLSKAKK